MKEREQEERRSIKKCLLRFPYIDKGENNWIPEKKKVEEIKVERERKLWVLIGCRSGESERERHPTK